MAGGSLPRGGKASYFRRLSEHVPQNIRTRVTEFIESVVFKEELEEITASVGKTVVPHEHEGKYAPLDHTHASTTHTHGWPTAISQLSDVNIGFVQPGQILSLDQLSRKWKNVENSADLVTTDFTDFDGLLIYADENVQAALDVLDDLMHEDLPDVGYHSHYDIDDHIDDATIHFTENSIHHPEPVTVAVSPGPSVTLGDDVVVTGVAPVTPTHVDAVAELVFLVTGEIVMA